MRKKSPVPPAFHLLGAMAAVGLIAVSALRGGGASQAPAPDRARITVEHRSPATLVLRASAGKSPGLLSLSHDGAEILLVDVPAAGGSDGTLLSGALRTSCTLHAAGGRRWHLPGGAVLTLRTDAYSGVTVRNPSGIPLLVRHTLVPLSSGKTIEDSVIVTKKDVEIW